jgi:hypothetical protein
LHQPVRLQRVQIIVDLLPSQADPRGQRRRKSDSVEQTILDLAALQSTRTLPGHFGPSHRRSQISRQ